jgi:type VI secretion system secreted protein VgrG
MMHAPTPMSSSDMIVLAERSSPLATATHSFQVEGLRDVLRVARFEGEEGLSRLFRFDITVLCETRDLDFSKVVGRRAELLLCLGKAQEPRRVQGVVESFEHEDEGKTLAAYRAVLAPEARRLEHRKGSRIFQALSVPDIVENVLLAAGLQESGFRFALSKRYPKREYCVQYRESDWAFLSRLMEADGIHYFFEHHDDGELLVIADGSAAHEAIAGDSAVAFRPPLGALARGEHVSRFRYAERVRPGKVTVRDYDFTRPFLSLETSARADGGQELEDYDYPGAYETPKLGAELARVRIEELQSTRRMGVAESSCPRLIPGTRFELVDHPRDDFNQEYLITRVEHRGCAPAPEASGSEQEAEYENRFDIIPASVPFRPLRRTPKPTMHGVQTAIVVGPQGQSVHTDEHGRVKVQFHWDREGRKDDKSSCWIRVSQAWAGAGFGAMFLPRVGHEVVVDFLEGDPDRPLIVGCLYHGANTPPYALPAKKTTSTVRSSSVGGDGANEIRFEDAGGSEELYVQAQKDYNELVKNNHATTVKANQTNDVAGNQSESVGGDQSVSVEGSRTIHVGGSQTITVDGTKPAAGIQGASLRVTGNYEVNASDRIHVQAPASILLECEGSSILLEPNRITFTAGGGAKVVLDAHALVESVVGARVLLDSNALMRSSAGAEVLLDANAIMRSTAGSQVLLDANASMTSTDGSQVLLDANATMSTSAEATVQGATAALLGASEATMAGGGGGAVRADGGGVTASGAKVDVAGSGAVNISGGVVKIN